MLFAPVQNCLKVFGRKFFATAVAPKYVIDSLQAAALKERCFLVDNSDNIIGTASKKECHLVAKDGTIPLHRAFSVFLFNTRGDLLLQKRSKVKITYPECYTNTCCSHPIQDIPGEDEEPNAIGVIRAARRRMNYELGINLDEMPIDKFKYLTRIHYFDTGNGQYGEHEIDYVLFIKVNCNLKPNPNEISEISFIPKEHMHNFVPTLNAPLTPWFNLILKHKLIVWWRDLDELEKHMDHATIHKLGLLEV